MPRYLGSLVVVGMVVGTAGARAQSTGMPSFNAPYRAFERSEFAGVVSSPNGTGTGIEGSYRYAAGTLDVGLRAGMWDPGAGGKTELLLGAELRNRMITHSVNFPLDGALVAGLGGSLVSGASTMFVPVGLSLGRRIELSGSSLSIVPYVQPTALLVVNSNTNLDFTMGFGADLRVSRAADLRFSAGIGDLHGLAFGVVWLH